jgi:hypothetical protein
MIEDGAPIPSLTKALMNRVASAAKSLTQVFANSSMIPAVLGAHGQSHQV